MKFSKLILLWQIIYMVNMIVETSFFVINDMSFLKDKVGDHATFAKFHSGTHIWSFLKVFSLASCQSIIDVIPGWMSWITWFCKVKIFKCNFFVYTVD